MIYAAKRRGLQPANTRSSYPCFADQAGGEWACISEGDPGRSEEERANNNNKIASMNAHRAMTALVGPPSGTSRPLVHAGFLQPPESMMTSSAAESGGDDAQRHGNQGYAIDGRPDVESRRAKRERESIGLASSIGKPPRSSCLMINGRPDRGGGGPRALVHPPRAARQWSHLEATQ